jgi:hypothetical protein
VLAEDQLEGKHATVIDLAMLKDRLLVLARTDSQSQTIRLGTGEMGSSGELFAEALATAESGAFARPAGPWGSAVVLVLGMALARGLAIRKKRMVVPLVPGFAAGYLLACLVVFETTRVALPLTPMVGLTVFVGALRLLEPGEGKRMKDEL